MGPNQEVHPTISMLLYFSVLVVCSNETDNTTIQQCIYLNTTLETMINFTHLISNCLLEMSPRTKMNRKTGPVSLSTLRRRTRVDIQKRLHQIRTDMTGIGADDRVLSENTVPPSSAAHAMPEVQVVTEEDMELEADFDDVYCDWCDGDGTSGSDSENDDDLTSLSDNIANWAVSFGISIVALTALLSILHVTHPNLPKDGRTLLKTKTHYAIQEKAGGNYHHFGILSSLKATISKYAKTLAEGMTLGLQINIDGLPLFKRSTVQLWPILGLLVTIPMKEPVVIGAYCGPKKPSSATEFLSDFVNELQELEAGFCFGD